MNRALSSVSKTKKAVAAFIVERTGIAAMEFALIAPIMILLFFGIVEGSNALAVSRRVSLAVNTLTDLASQETQLTASQTTDLFNGVEQIVGQGNITAQIRLVSVILDPDTGDAIVHWSHDNSGAAPYAPGSTYTGLADASLLDASTSLIVGELVYAYSSPLTKVVISGVNFDKTATRWPRRAARVQFCTSPSICTS